MSQHFAITIGETMTCLTFHATKSQKIFKDFAFILPLEKISKKGKKMRTISYEKMNHLGMICVTMKDLMDKFYETTELSVLYVKNAPSQAIQPENPILKKNCTEIANATKNIPSNIQF